MARVAAEKDFKLTCEDLGSGRAAIVAEGVSAHASMPHLGKNAAGMLLIALKALEAGGNSRGSIAALADVLGLQYDGAALGIAQADEPVRRADLQSGHPAVRRRAPDRAARHPLSALRR